MSFNFVTPKTVTGFTLPTTTTTPTLSSAGGGAGDAKLLHNKPTLFGTVTSTPSTGFGLGASTAPSTGFSLGGTTTANTGFSLGGATTNSSLTFSPAAAKTTAANATPALQFNLGSGSIASTTSVTSFTPILSTSSATTFGTPTTGTTSLKLTPATTSSTLNLGTTTTLTTATTSVTTSSSAIPTIGTLTYAQLEDSINKWTIDLEEQGKLFINQAKQLNAWDNLLVSNGDKILNLNETIERVKQQQKQLDQELDFILAQQNELDELSLPLEKQLADIPVTDQNRFQMYQTSEIIDSQLKQMSEDLKEIVEHLNESNKNEDIADPVTQVSRILNAHMNSLQWIDRNTSLISSQMEQISKLQELNKKNHLNF